MTNPSLLIVPDRFKASKLYSQLPQDGSGDFVVTRATTAYRTNAAGILESVANNVPRLDFPSGSGCPALLVEPAATNLALRSAEFNDASWTKTNTTITANTTISPDGSQNADTMDVVDGNSRITQTVSLGAGTYTISAYVRVLSTTTAGQLRFAPVVDGSNVNSFFSATSGWQRFTQTFTAVSGVTSVALRGAAGGFVGTIAVYGFQLETGSVATSYIPTVAAAATRNADVISNTAVSGLIGQQEGVVYWEGILPEIGTGGAAAENNIFNTEREPATRTGWSIRHRANTGTLFASLFIGNGTLVPIISLNTVGFAAGSFAKIAFAYKSGSTALFVNGVLRASATTTFTSVTTMNAITLADSVVIYGFPARQFVSAAALYTTRLSNAQLQSLTTL
jgi:hypothetical protein